MVRSKTKFPTELSAMIKAIDNLKALWRNDPECYTGPDERESLESLIEATNEYKELMMAGQGSTQLNAPVYGF